MYKIYGISVQEKYCKLHYRDDGKLYCEDCEYNDCKCATEKPLYYCEDYKERREL